MPRHDTAATKKAKGSKRPALTKKATTKKGKSSSYNVYMNAKMAVIKKEEPTLAHKDAMQKAMDAWKAEQKGKTPA